MSDQNLLRLWYLFYRTLDYESAQRALHHAQLWDRPSHDALIVEIHRQDDLAYAEFKAEQERAGEA